MNRKINKYYFDINSEAKYIFFECKNGLHYMLSNSICSYIPELPPNAREYPNKWNSQKWNKCGKNGFLFYDVVFSVKIITAFLRMSTILIYILVFSPVWIPFIS